METTFQTQEKTTIQPQEEGFLTGLRKFSLAAVVSIIMLSGITFSFFYSLQNAFGYFDSYAICNLLINSLNEIVFDGMMIFVIAHTVCGKHAKPTGIATLVILGFALIIGLSAVIYQYHYFSEPNPNHDHFRTVNSVFNLVNNLLFLSLYIILSIAGKKKYRLGFIALAVAALLACIAFGPAKIVPESVAWKVFTAMIFPSINAIGWCYLLYLGLQIPGKKSPQKTAIEFPDLQGSIAYKVFNLIAAAFIVIYLIFAVFFKPHAESYYVTETFMPAGAFLLEVISLALIVSMVILSFKVKTISTKVTGFVLAGVLLTVNLAFILVSIFDNPRYLSEGICMTNIITIIVYTMMMIVWLWMIKTQTTGTTRQAMSLSVATLTATLAMTCKYSNLSACNYGGYGEDHYFSAVIIILAFFIVAPWLLLHLVKQSWPKMRMIFMAIPLGVVMLGFTVLRLNMNGSWNRANYGYGFSNDYTNAETAIDSLAEDTDYTPAVEEVPTYEENEESEIY